MQFDILTADNFMMFAMKHYDNPQSVTYDDFLEDMMRFKYLKRLFGRYIYIYATAQPAFVMHMWL